MFGSFVVESRYRSAYGAQSGRFGGGEKRQYGLGKKQLG